jgi:hypothetical protein
VICWQGVLQTQSITYGRASGYLASTSDTSQQCYDSVMTDKTKPDMLHSLTLNHSAISR